jgi:hypothetical protein
VYRDSGYGFTTYPDVGECGVSQNSNYGISLNAPDWIRAQTALVSGLREVTFERTSDHHQDVFGFARQD